MKNIAINLLLALLSGANSDISLYEQNIVAEFDTPEIAQKVQAQILKFPNDKKIAFSTRWDDTNLRHSATAKMLSERDVKASCYFVGMELTKEEIKTAHTVLSLGGSIGAHSITHPFLEAINPNEAFRQIALERAYLESTLNTNISAFVLPFCTYDSMVDKNIKRYIGLSILNAGYRACPEFERINKISYGLSKDSILLGSQLFGIDDRNPQETLFDKRLKIARKNISNGADPHITLGIHSWQDDEALERLGKYIDKRKSDEFWYCNENEYAAYTIQYQNSAITKLSVDGNKVKFRLTRPAAFNIGDDIPLELRFSENPKNIFVEKTKVNKVGDFYKIDHLPNYKTPKKIELIEISDDNLITSKKFDSLEFSLSFGNSGSLDFTLKNNAKEALKQFRLKWVLPPNYVAPYLSKIDSLDIDYKIHKESLDLNLKSIDSKDISGETFECSVSDKKSIDFILRKDKSWVDSFSEGDISFIVCCDFLYKGEPVRVWLHRKKPQKCLNFDCPRDRVVGIGIIKNETISYSDIEKMSQKGSFLYGMDGKNGNRSL